MVLLKNLKQLARRCKAEAVVLYFAVRHPQTPLFAKLVAVAVVAYLFSPIDLIPDFIPILGYLDDLVLVPLGIALAFRLIPAPILVECREQAGRFVAKTKTLGRIAAALVVVIWLILLWLAMLWANQLY